jgi:hypothetical protein
MLPQLKSSPLKKGLTFSRDTRPHFESIIAMGKGAGCNAQRDNAFSPKIYGYGDNSLDDM